MPVISHFIMMGDSLSDRGTLDHRYLFGIIPMAWLGGLTGKSPRGRFTNGFAWSDDISATLADEFIIHRAENKGTLGGGQKKYNFNAADVSDDILTQRKATDANANSDQKTHLDTTDIADNVISDRHFQRSIQHSYTLDNDLYVQYRGRDFVRSYDEGGLTAHDYSWIPSTSISRFFSRLILSTLGKKREALLDHDKKLEVSVTQKKQTLIIEWSGANDLITVNARPSEEEADRAISDRISNAEKLIKQGYRNFVLFNLPDLSLTPRFQNMTGEDGNRERQNAQNISKYFNDNLLIACALLQKKYSGSSVEVFDIGAVFTDIYDDTKDQTNRYPGRFELDKLKTPYTKSKDFVIKNGLSPASGYMFWDDVHPTANMHALLADQFYKTYQNKYMFSAPKIETAKMLCDTFRKKYSDKFNKDVHGFFGLFRRSNLPKIDYTNPDQALAMILKHALYSGGNRTRGAITDLQWIDAKGNINVQIPALKAAKAELDAISRPALRKG